MRFDKHFVAFRNKFNKYKSTNVKILYITLHYGYKMFFEISFLA